MPQLTVALLPADSNHWNIKNDVIFPDCLTKFKARHEASLASGATKSTRKCRNQGQSSTLTHKLPLPATPQPPPPSSLGPSEVTLRTAQFEQYDKDFPEVKEVHAKILGLKEGEEATQEDFDSSPNFQLKWAANETHQPKVIGEHWIDYLERKGHLVLYAQGDSPLIAVIPPNLPFQYEQEYVIHWLHKAECLSRMSVYFNNNQRKQIAFCPYCGVLNENSATAYSHVRKHLGITFLCGGCYGKLYKAPQHLFNHIKSCHPCVMSRPESSQGEGSHRGRKSKQ